MRASTAIVGSLIMIAAVTILGVLFLAVVTNHMIALATERSKLSLINEARMALEVTVLSAEATQVHVQVTNIGEREFFVYIAAGHIDLTKHVPVFHGDTKLYVLREISVLDIQQCSSQDHCVPVTTTIKTDNVFTEDEFTLSEIGSGRVSFPAAGFLLPPGSSKVLMVRMPPVPEGKAPAIFAMVKFNDKLYYVSRWIVR
ncbi:MAG: hypothetical protein ABDH61_00615 [Acidilobaceae archaeon]